MPARICLVSVAVLAVIAGTLIEVSGADLPKQARCLRACGLDKEKSFTRPIQVLKSFSCYQCLRRRKDRHSFSKENIIQRRKRSTFSDNCIGRVDDGTPVPEEQYASEPTVIFGQYENTDNWYADVSWTPLDDPGGYLTEHLIRLSVGYGPDILCTVLPKDQTSLRINISHYGYHYPDDIKLLVLSIPYNLTAVGMTDYSNIPLPSSPLPRTSTTTSKPTTTKPTVTIEIITKGSTVLNSSSTTLVPPTPTAKGFNKTIQYFVFISTAITAGVLAGILAVVLLRKFLLRRKGYLPTPAGFENHVFIMFNMEDSEWMKNNLLHLLEEKHHLKCRIHYRDFEVGSIYYESISDSIHTSYKNIAVYSKNFLNGGCCLYELQLAEQRLLSKNDDSLVIIRIDEADLQELPEGLRNRSVIDYYSILERPHWVKKLLKFLNVPDHSSKPRATAEQNIEDSNYSDAGHTMKASTVNNGRVRTHIDRLNSTNSNDTEVSFVQLVKAFQ